MSVLEQKVDPSVLTHSAAHHVLATAELIDECGYARVSDIARRLGLTRGSVSVAMKSLKTAGLVDQDDNAFFHLTDNGAESVVSLRGRHEVVQRFMIEVLGLSHDQAHREGCRLEYLIEPDTASRLSGLLKFWNDKKLALAAGEYLGGPCPSCLGLKTETCPCCGLQKPEE
ncbi:MAG: metal-dependent transcriptional regulator [Phycisphaerales bacterium]|jgi:DtxR family transcriptional regulator, Mn-dependent transcriptional regulator|nr:metal-dependent transcriptional regulator [Phycisphaerales bacterium]